MLAALYTRDPRDSGPFRLDVREDDYYLGLTDWNIEGVTYLHSSDLGLSALSQESLLIPVALLDELPMELNEVWAQQLIRGQA